MENWHERNKMRTEKSIWKMLYVEERVRERGRESVEIVKERRKELLGKCSLAARKYCVIFSIHNFLSIFAFFL